MDIEKLLEKYYEGETTVEEERLLRAFFRGTRIPEHLKPYAPLFIYWDEGELEETGTEVTEASEFLKPTRWHLIFKKYSGVAAIFLLLLGLAATIHYQNSSHKNYVIIDGKKYTDISLVREQAQAAFMDVSFNEDDIFSALFGD